MKMKLFFDLKVPTFWIEKIFFSLEFKNNIQKCTVIFSNSSAVLPISSWSVSKEWEFSSKIWLKTHFLNFFYRPNFSIDLKLIIYLPFIHWTKIYLFSNRLHWLSTFWSVFVCVCVDISTWIILFGICQCQQPRYGIVFYTGSRFHGTTTIRPKYLLEFGREKIRKKSLLTDKLGESRGN